MLWGAQVAAVRKALRLSQQRSDKPKPERSSMNARLLERLSESVVNSLSLPLYWASFAVPRHKDIWVFGGWFGHRYADNSRYLFEYVCANEPSIRAVWLSHERQIVEDVRHAGHEAHLINSWRGYWISCRAALAVFCVGNLDVNRVGISRAKRLQLWHGMGFKKIGLDDRKTTNPRRSLAFRVQSLIRRAVWPFVRQNWDAIIATSPTSARRLASGFGADESRIKLSGYPRHDVILDQNPEPLPVIESLKARWSAKKVVCYAPTHRQGGSGDVDIFSSFDLEALDACLARHEAVFVIKMHYHHRDLTISSLSPEVSRVHWLSEGECPDISLLLPHVDVLVSDYSAAATDFLLLDRPILFAPFDRETYLRDDHEFYEDYDASTPGPKCADWDELTGALEEALGGVDRYGDARRAALRKYFSFVDTENSRRVFLAAKELVNGSGGGARARTRRERLGRWMR